MKKIAVILSILSLSFAQAQDDVSLEGFEAELTLLLSNVRSAEGDEKVLSANQEFRASLEEALSIPGAFSNDFSYLKTMGAVTSPDNKLRVFSWNVELEGNKNVYFCYILNYDKRKKQYLLSELTDNSLNSYMPVGTKEIITKDNWYGALYYQIIPVKKGSKTYYTLLGYDANTVTSNIKLIDVLYFSGKNPKLGYNMFLTKDGIQKRVIMEHSEKAVMTLRFDKERNKIVFDHLAPETPSLKEFRDYYVPDMSYDAFKFTNSKWILEEDVIAVNDENGEKVTMRYVDPDTGEVVSKDVKNKWLDPTGNKAPVDGGGHTAVTPEDVEGDGQGKKKKKTKKKRTKKSKFNGVQYGNLPETKRN